MSATKTIDFAKLELKPDHKYILFVDPTRVDCDLFDADPNRLPPEVMVIPVLCGAKSIMDCVRLIPVGGTADEYVENFLAQEDRINGVSK